MPLAKMSIGERVSGGNPTTLIYFRLSIHKIHFDKSHIREHYNPIMCILYARYSSILKTTVYDTFSTCFMIILFFFLMPHNYCRYVIQTIFRNCIKYDYIAGPLFVSLLIYSHHETIYGFIALSLNSNRSFRQ